MWLNICFYSDKMVTSAKDREGVETGDRGVWKVMSSSSWHKVGKCYGLEGSENAVGTK